MKTVMSAKVGMPLVLTFICVLIAPLPAVAQEEEKPQKVALKGEFVRVGYNDEAWVVVGYRAANESVGKEWMLLDVGITLVKSEKHQQVTRDEVSLVAPDGSVIPLASQQEYQAAAGSLAALEEAANMVGDSINYFPPGTDEACRIGFFSAISQPDRGAVYDFVEVSRARGCVGRLYFRVPGGIQYGDYVLNVQFDGSVVRTPLLIMTKQELKEIKKEVKKLEKEAKKKAKEGG
jgi:hypothetical protein